jgi:hypothetical protein
VVGESSNTRQNFENQMLPGLFSWGFLWKKYHYLQFDMILLLDYDSDVKICHIDHDDRVILL